MNRYLSLLIVLLLVSCNTGALQSHSIESVNCLKIERMGERDSFYPVVILSTDGNTCGEVISDKLDSLDYTFITLSEPILKAIFSYHEANQGKVEDFDKKALEGYRITLNWKEDRTYFKEFDLVGSKNYIEYFDGIVDMLKRSKINNDTIDLFISSVNYYEGGKIIK